MHFVQGVARFGRVGGWVLCLALRLFGCSNSPGGNEYVQ